MAFPAPEITSIKLGKGGCLGECPVFTFVIQEDGTGTYEGIRFVKMLGIDRATGGQKQFLRLVQVFKERRFFELPDGRGHSIIDLPLTTISATRNGDEKRVSYDSLLAPTDFQSLTKEIEQVIRKLSWKKVKEKTRFKSN